MREEGKDSAVSTVIGTSLMVGLVVVSVVGVAFALQGIEPPLDTHKADIAIELDPGLGQWGTGDERVVLRHVGGEAIPEGITRILISHNGAASTYQGGTIGFANGSFAYGDAWSNTRTILPDDELYVRITTEEDTASVLLAETILRPSGGLDCSGDTGAPVVARWQAAPGNVTAANTGGVRVVMDLRDDCSGVVGVGGFQYRLNDGSNPAWTAVPAEVLGGDRFAADVPAQNWPNHVGKTLQMQLLAMEDALGNTGDGAVFNDTVDPLPGVHDPGFPYMDTNCDGLYSNSTDLPVPLPQVVDGSYDARPYCLVLPPSVGDIAPGTRIDFKGRGVWIDVNLTSRGERIHIEAQDYWIIAPNVILDAEQTERVHLETQGDIDIRGSTLHARNERVHVVAGGTLLMDDAYLWAENGESNATAGSWVSAQRTAMQSDRGAVRVSGASVDALDASFVSKLQIEFRADGDLSLRNAVMRSNAGEEVRVLELGANTVFIQGSTVDRNGSPDVAYYPPSGSVSGTPVQGTWVAN